MPQLYSTICSTDAAVDVAESQISKFWVTRDEAHLVMRAGATPTRFHLRRIPRRLVRNFIEMGANDTAKTVRSFMTAIVRVDHCPRFDAQSELTCYEESWQPEWAGNAAPAVECMTEAEADRFDIDSVMEVGSVAYQQCFLAPESGRCYAVPLSSHAALERALSPHADEMLELLDQSSAAARARLRQLLKPNGEAPTDAAVTESSTTVEPSTPPSLECSEGSSI